MKKEIIQCDECENTDMDLDVKPCPVCKKDYCSDCYDSHLIDEHEEELIDAFNEVHK